MKQCFERQNILWTYVKLKYTGQIDIRMVSARPPKVRTNENMESESRK